MFYINCNDIIKNHENKTKNSLQHGTSYVTKVIKNTRYGSTYYWNSDYSSNWTTDTGWLAGSSFNNTTYGQTNNNNNIYYLTNTTIYNSLDSTLKNQIASGRYYFRANKTSKWIYDYSANDIYKYERNGTAYWSSGYADCNIALLNASDYKYATLTSVNSSCSRTSTGNYSDVCGQNNWIGKMMYNNIGNGNRTWMLNVPGYWDGSNWYTGANTFVGNRSYNSMYLNSNDSMSGMYYIFPVFYLKNQTYCSKGNGTNSNPYYIAI